MGVGVHLVQKLFYAVYNPFVQCCELSPLKIPVNGQICRKNCNSSILKKVVLILTILRSQCNLPCLIGNPLLLAEPVATTINSQLLTVLVTIMIPCINNVLLLQISICLFDFIFFLHVNKGNDVR